MAKPKAAPLPHVTPEDARQVWDSLPEPSRRKVADRLNASGKFAPISEASVGRWQRNGWTHKADPKNHRKDGPEEKLGQALVVATGDPCADAVGALGDSPAFQELVELTLDELQDQATRDRWATYILAQRMARGRFAEFGPDVIAKMEKAMSGALKDMAAAQAITVKAQAKLAPLPGDGAKLIEHNEFDSIRDAWRKAAAAA
jgi:hypothetical protein